jgi:hypothetical protein
VNFLPPIVANGSYFTADIPCHIGRENREVIAAPRLCVEHCQTMLDPLHCGGAGDACDATPQIANR